MLLNWIIETIKYKAREKEKVSLGGRNEGLRKGNKRSCEFGEWRRESGLQFGSLEHLMTNGNFPLTVSFS